MHLGGLTNKQFAIAAAAVALTFFLLGVIASQAGAAPTGGVGSAGGRADESASGKYERIWNGLRVRDKRWAHETAQCESGGDPNALGAGGLYRGAFQFTRSAWKSSPQSPGGDPITFPYKTQAVVAVLLMHRDGTGPWPVCG
jgi:hypothetical protein